MGAAGLGTAAVAGISAFTGGSPAAPTAMELGLGADDIMASCMPVNSDILDEMPLAFAATDGVGNYCGYTGPATPELEAIDDAAFTSGP